MSGSTDHGKSVRIPSGEVTAWSSGRITIDVYGEGGCATVSVVIPNWAAPAVRELLATALEDLEV